MSIDIADNELVPVQNLTVFINDTYKECTFLPDGTFVSGCNNMQMMYANAAPAEYGVGFGYGYGYGSGSNEYANTTFGYGYGYGGEPGYTDYTGEMIYILAWNASAENAPAGSYTAELEAYAQGPSGSFTYTSPQTFSFTINATINRASVLSSIQNQQATEDLYFSYQATATDADGDTLTYSLTDFPIGMQINSTSGLIEWTPTNAQSLVGAYNVTVMVSDGQAADNKTFLVSVTEVNDAPVLATLPDLNGTEDIDFSINMTPYVTDIDSNSFVYSSSSAYATVIGDIITFNYPNGVTNETVTITVSDGELSDSDTIQNTITPVNDAPTTPIVDLTPDSPLDTNNLICTITTASTDVDSETVYYNYTWKKNNVAFASSMTTSLSAQMNSTATANAENWSCEVFATDGQLNSATSTDTVQIGHTAPSALSVVDVIPNSASTTDTLTCNTSTSNETITYAWYKNDVAIGITTQTIAPVNTSRGETWKCVAKVYDGVAYSATKSDEVFIQNTKPAINTATPSGTATSTTEGTNKVFTLSATDADSTDSLSYTWYKNGAVAGTGITYTFPATYTSAGAYKIKGVVSDGSLSTENTWDLTVNDNNRDPVISTIGAQSCTEREACIINVGASDSDADNTIKFYDNSTLFTIGLEDGKINFTSPDVSADTTYNTRVTVVDNKGGYDTEVFALTIQQNNRKPTLDPIGDLTAIQGTAFTKQLTASDPDGEDTLTFTDDTSLFNIGSSGLINFTPGPGDVGVHNVTITVSDGNGGTDNETLVVAVKNTNDAPTIDTYYPSSSTPSMTEGTVQTFNITTSDADGTTPTVKWYLDTVYKALGPKYTYNANYTSKGTHTVKVTVSDGIETVSRTWSLTVSDNNRAPVLSAIPTLQATEDSKFTYTITATDQDTDNTLVYTDNSPLFNIGILTGKISFTPTQSAVGLNTVKVYVADGTTKVSKTFILNVSNVNDVPVLTPIGALTAVEGNAFTYTASATDDDSDTLTFSDNSDLFNINASTGLISFTPTTSDSGTYNVRITVTDGNGGEDFEDITLTVLNTNQAPSVTPVNPTEQNTSIKEDSQVTFNATASDPDGTTPGIKWLLDGNLVGTGASYTFKGNFTESNAGNYNVTVLATDGLLYDTYEWNLTVNRTRDSDSDLIPDYTDNCPLIYNPDQTDLDGSTPEGLLCENNADGDNLLDDQDFVEGTSDNLDSNVEGLSLNINGSDDLNRLINETQGVTFTYNEYDNATGAATQKTMVDFNFTFNSTSKLDLGNVSIKKQSSTTAGEIVVSGIDLTGQNKTKTVYVDDLSSEDGVCIKDAEIASVSEITSSCDSADETVLSCTASGATKTFNNHTYTCTDEGSTYKISGLVHSGVLEDSCSPSWSCDSWSTCSGSTKTCDSWTDSNSCGETYSGSNTKTCSSATNNNAGSSFNTTRIATKTVAWTEVLANAQKTMNVGVDELFMTTIKFTLANRETDVSINVKEASEPENTLSNAYKYIQITASFNNDNVVNALINFKVDKAWMSQNGYEVNNIALYRYHNNEWQKLTTSYVSQDSNNNNYQAETPGFSTFAIGPKKVTTTGTGTETGTGTGTEGTNTGNETGTGTGTKGTETNTTNNTAPGTNKGTTSNPWAWILLVLVVVGIVLFVIFRRKK